MVEKKNFQIKLKINKIYNKRIKNKTFTKKIYRKNFLSKLTLTKLKIKKVKTKKILKIFLQVKSNNNEFSINIFTNIE